MEGTKYQYLQLFRMIFLYELRRHRVFIILMALALLISGLLLTPSENFESSFEFQMSMNSQGDEAELMQHSLFLELMQLSVVSFQILPALIFGLVLAVLFPWRKQEHWDNGSFQMWLLSPWPSYIWESFRIITYVLFLLIYYALLLSMTAFSLNQRLEEPYQIISTFLTLLLCLLFTLLPFLLGLSSLLTSLKSAYRHQNRNWTISIMLGICWWVMVSNALSTIFRYSRNPEGLLLKPIQINLSAMSSISTEQMLYWYPEWFLISAVLAVAMTVLAGRVYNEIEVL